MCLATTAYAQDCTAWKWALDLIRPLLCLGDQEFLANLRAELSNTGIVEAAIEHDTATIYDWLAETIQFQGISDASASTYMQVHGHIRWKDVEEALAQRPACSRLTSYWAFSSCGYRKAAATCAEPVLLPTCPLPLHPARNGRLSQAAFSLFLFIRDVCDGDFVAWLDHQLEHADQHSPPHLRIASMRNAVLEPMANIHGVSSKVLSMALASLMLGADPARERWVTTGAHMIVVDTLVHNFLCRSGILHRLGADHRYGAGCYAESGCRSILERMATMIDARAFNPTFPRVFPRFIQYTLWRFCAQSGFNICNGNQIDDTDRCQNHFCPVIFSCSRQTLL